MKMADLLGKRGWPAPDDQSIPVLSRAVLSRAVLFRAVFRDQSCDPSHGQARCKTKAYHPACCGTHALTGIWLHLVDTVRIKPAQDQPIQRLSAQRPGMLRRCNGSIGWIKPHRMLLDGPHLGAQILDHGKSHRSPIRADTAPVKKICPY